MPQRRSQTQNSPDCSPAAAGGQGTVQRLLCTGARFAGKATGHAQNVMRQLLATPTGQEVKAKAGDATAKARQNVMPAARRMAGNALDAADLMLCEIGSKCDESLRASEVGRRNVVDRNADMGLDQDSESGRQAFLNGSSARVGSTEPVTPDSPALLTPTQRKAAGLALLIAGIPMLILPGPGVASIIAGIALMRSSGSK